MTRFVDDPIAPPGEGHHVEIRKAGWWRYELTFRVSLLPLEDSWIGWTRGPMFGLTRARRRAHRWIREQQPQQPSPPIEVVGVGAGGAA